MEKLLLLSGLVMMVVIPLRAARLGDPRRALRRALTRFFAFNVLYWGAVVVIWFTLLHGGDASSLLHKDP
jgi:heme/copper-type cytochrome/quinol oxidase subunit 3